MEVHDFRIKISSRRFLNLQLWEYIKLAVRVLVTVKIIIWKPLKSIILTINYRAPPEYVEDQLLDFRLMQKCLNPGLNVCGIKVNFWVDKYLVFFNIMSAIYGLI